MAHKWYAIQTYAGSEMSVKRAIENLVKDHGIEEQLLEVVVPTEDVISNPLKDTECNFQPLDGSM